MYALRRLMSLHRPVSCFLGLRNPRENMSGSHSRRTASAMRTRRDLRRSFLVGRVIGDVLVADRPQPPSTEIADVAREPMVRLVKRAQLIGGKLLVRREIRTRAELGFDRSAPIGQPVRLGVVRYRPGRRAAALPRCPPSCPADSGQLHLTAPDPATVSARPAPRTLRSWSPSPSAPFIALWAADSKPALRSCRGRDRHRPTPRRCSRRHLDRHLGTPMSHRPPSAGAQNRPAMHGGPPAKGLRRQRRRNPALRSGFEARRSPLG